MKKANGEIPYKIYLNESELPKAWYNLRADMKEDIPPALDPGTLKPVTVEEISAVFCKELAIQELTKEAYIPIPEEIQNFLKVFRPSPLVRAYNLEKALNTPAKIYYKYEGNNTSGSHKLNSAVAQAYYAKEQGLTSLTTETGAGQWGTALSIACAHYGIDLEIFMVKVSTLQKPYRKAIMETFGARVIPSPSNTTEAGKKILAEFPEHRGSLGCAISEAVERAVTTKNCRYVLGSVLNQVLLHQSVIGLEAYTAFEKIGEYPDIVIGCAGGGSNLGGLIAPFMRDKIQGKKNTEFIAVEPASCPSLTRGKYAYDFCDTGKVTPLEKMYTLGCEFQPSSIHAGGLRYHGMSPILSKLYHDGYMKATSVSQLSIFDAAILFAKAETILPAPESAHAIKGAIDAAIECREKNEEKTILFGLTGNGSFDLAAYQTYMTGDMQDYSPSDEELQKSFAKLPKVD